MKNKLKAACACTTGHIRQNNEDNFCFDQRILPQENNGLEQTISACSLPLESSVAFGVFDGMGGEADGQVASYLSASTFRNLYETQGNVLTARKLLKQAVFQMNDCVRKKAESSFSRMGSTAVIFYFCEDLVYVCNVGDSRAFRFRDNTLVQLSKDHTDAEFLASRGITNRKPRLNQYIGMSTEDGIPEPYIAKGHILPGDQYLLCSDGLTDMLSNAEITAILKDSQDATNAVNSLISAAMEHGGRDNTTAIVIQVLHENDRNNIDSQCTVSVEVEVSDSFGESEPEEPKFMTPASVCASLKKEELSVQNQKPKPNLSKLAESEEHQIAAPASPVIESKKKTKGIIAGGIIICIVAFLSIAGIMWHRQQATVMPNVIGLTLVDAQSELSQIGISTSEVVTVFSDEIPQNIVVNANYNAGDRVRKGAAATITVSLGPEITIFDIEPAALSADLADVAILTVTSNVDLSDYDITWYSDDETVAVIPVVEGNKATIQVVGTGNCTITAELALGDHRYKSECVIMCLKTTEPAKDNANSDDYTVNNIFVSD